MAFPTYPSSIEKKKKNNQKKLENWKKDYVV